MAKPKPKLLSMRNGRRVSQVAFFALFLALLALTVYPLGSRWHVDLFLVTDPLNAIVSTIASRHLTQWVWPSLIVIVGTALFGRFFCGWICPMGTAIDLSDRFLVRAKPERGTSRYRNIKFYLLAALLVTAVFAAQASYLFDPISLITRTFVWVLAAPLLMLGNWAADRVPALANTPLIPEVQPHFQMGLAAALIFGGILALGMISKRFWCRNLCPLGAVLAILSKFGIVRRKVDGVQCIDCKICDRDCKMAAIPSDPREYQAPECIYCYNCVSVCASASTRIPLSVSKKGHQTGLDLNRRRLLGAAGVGVLWVALARGDAGSKLAGNMQIKSSSPQLIRPPGALAEAEFLDRCTRCGLCMKACPTNGLQPALTEAGIEGLWTPILVPRIGYCSQHCTLCGDVCPPHAIEPFAENEKEHLYIGRATIDRSTCLVWAQDKQCLVCDEHCSYKALHWKVVDGIRRPLVDDVKCTGCGECETKCPIQPLAAIRVTSMGDMRHLSRDAQKAVRSQAPSTMSGPSPYGGH